jgi:hypothetical protein
MQTVDIPGQGTASFPDEMTPEQIGTVIHQQFFSDQPTAPPPATSQEPVAPISPPATAATPQTPEEVVAAHMRGELATAEQQATKSKSEEAVAQARQSAASTAPNPGESEAEWTARKQAAVEQLKPVTLSPEEIAANAPDAPLVSAQTASEAFKHTTIGQAMEETRRALNYLFPQNAPANVVAKSIEGLEAGAGSVASSFSTPSNIALLVGTGGLGKLANTAIGGYFAYQAIRQVPDQWRAFNAETDPAKKAQLLVEMGASIGVPATILLHAYKDLRPEVKKAAEVGPETAKVEAAAGGLPPGAPPLPTPVEMRVSASGRGRLVIPDNATPEQLEAFRQHVDSNPTLTPESKQALNDELSAEAVRRQPTHSPEQLDAMQAQVDASDMTPEEKAQMKATIDSYRGAQAVGIADPAQAHAEFLTDQAERVDKLNQQRESGQLSDQEYVAQVSKIFQEPTPLEGAARLPARAPEEVPPDRFAGAKVVGAVMLDREGNPISRVGNGPTATEPAEPHAKITTEAMANPDNLVPLLDAVGKDFKKGQQAGHGFQVQLADGTFENVDRATAAKVARESGQAGEGVTSLQSHDLKVPEAPKLSDAAKTALKEVGAKEGKFEEQKPPGTVRLPATEPIAPELAERNLQENLHEFQRTGDLATKEGADKIKSHLQSVVTDRSLPANFRALATHLLKVLGDTSKLKLELLYDPSTSTLGEYIPSHTDPQTGTVAINLAADHGSAGVTGTMLHELVHHVTLRKLDPGYKLTRAERRAYRNIEAIYQLALRAGYERKFGKVPNASDLIEWRKEHAKGGELYGLANIHEFVTESTTNPRFQAALRNLPIPAETDVKAFGAYRNFVDAVLSHIRDLFFGDTPVPERNALEHTLESFGVLTKLAPRAERLTGQQTFYSPALTNFRRGIELPPGAQLPASRAEAEARLGTPGEALRPAPPPKPLAQWVAEQDRLDMSKEMKGRGRSEEEKAARITLGTAVTRMDALRTGLVPDHALVQKALGGAAKAAKELRTQLQAELAAKYPAEPVPEGSKVTYVKSATGDQLPNIEKPTGRTDARGLPITRVEHQFTNDPDITAQQLERGGRVRPPEDLVNSNRINPAIHLETDAEGDYVASVDTKYGEITSHEQYERAHKEELVTKGKSAGTKVPYDETKAETNVRRGTRIEDESTAMAEAFESGLGRAGEEAGGNVGLEEALAEGRPERAGEPVEEEPVGAAPPAARGDREMLEGKAERAGIPPDMIMSMTSRELEAAIKGETPPEDNKITTGWMHPNPEKFTNVEEGALGGIGGHEGIAKGQIANEYPALRRDMDRLIKRTGGVPSNEQVNALMAKHKFVRVIGAGSGHTIYIQGEPTRAQLARLRDAAIEQRVDIVDDNGRTIAHGAQGGELPASKPEDPVEIEQVVDATGKIRHEVVTKPTATLEDLQLAAEKIDQQKLTPEAQKQIQEALLEKMRQAIGDGKTGPSAAIVDAQRAARGLVPRVEPMRRADPVVWAEMERRIADDPQMVETLIKNSLTQRARPLEDWEVAALAREQAIQENAFDNARDAVNSAKTDTDRAAAKYRLARAEDAMNAVHTALQKSGTRTARALRFFQILVDTDKLTMSRMESEWKAAKGGKELTTVEKERLQTLYDALSKGKDRADVIEALKQASRDYQRVEKLEQLNKEAADAVAKGDTATATAKAEEAKKARAVIESQMRQTGERTPKEAAALERYKKALATRMKNLQEKMAAKDFTRAKRGKIQLDAEATAAKIAYQRLREQFNAEIDKAKRANRDWLQKSIDFYVNFKRGAVISSPLAQAKIMATTLTRLVTRPMRDAVSEALKRTPVIGRAFEKAPRAGFNAEAQGLAYTKGLKLGIKDAMQILFSKTGTSDLDAALGKLKSDETAGPILRFLQRTHSAGKAPAVRVEYERSLATRTAHAVANGVDVSDPLVEMSLQYDAYKDANMDRFQQDSHAVNAYKAALAGWERPDPLTGKASVGRRLTGAYVRGAIPVLKIPTNIIAEGLFDHTFGTITGGSKLVSALVKGVENLKPEQADIMNRQLARGLIGNALWYLGWVGYQQIGGYWTPGHKAEEGELKPGEIEIHGVTIPRYVTHAAKFTPFLLGATMHQLYDQHVEDDGWAKAFSEATALSLMGDVEEQPFIKEMLDFGKLFDARQQGQFFKEWAASYVPQAIQWTAKYLDDNTPRQPKTFEEYMKSTVPYLRSEVPERPSR